MRISEFLRASCVGALLFSPAMADDIEKMHEDALRVLREKLGQASEDLAVPAASTTAIINAPVFSASPETPQMRERDTRIKAEAQQRLAEREHLQADRRQQFERWIQERERLRQQQRVLNGEPGTDELHAKALDALHSADYGLSTASSAGSAATAPVQLASASATILAGSSTSVTTAPVPSKATMTLAQADIDQVHAQALEALHQQTQSQPAKAAASPAPTNSGPQPSPELQRRLKQMQLELEQEQMQKQAASNASASAPTTASVPDSYTKDLEERARQQSSSSVPPVGISSSGASVGNNSSGLDPATRDILRRQDQEIARKMGSNSSGAAPVTQGLTPDQEAQAREAIRQQQASTQANVPTTPPSNPSVTPPKSAKPTTTATTHHVETDNSNVQYSKELEDRARQILAERAQNQPNTTVQSPAPPDTVIVPSAPAQTAVTPQPAPAPVTPSAPAPVAAPSTTVPEPSSEVHNRALDTLNQIQAGTAPKTKQERIKELTDLYRADKMSPAEYHQKRAAILAEPQ